MVLADPSCKPSTHSKHYLAVISFPCEELVTLQALFLCSLGLPASQVGTEMNGLAPWGKVIPGTIAAFGVAYVLDWMLVITQISSSVYVA